MTYQECLCTEYELVLAAIHCCSGHDFGHYVRAPLERRISQFAATRGFTSPSQLIPGIIHDDALRDALLEELTVTVTGFFRDPDFFMELRQQVIPWLRTYPEIRIWHAGCSTGEEVASMVILLEEEGLLHRCVLHATDCNEQALVKARSGEYALASRAAAETDYRLAGGSRSLADFGRWQGGTFCLEQRLLDHMSFANHNLVTDDVFMQAHLVCCRNVLIYFDRTLKDAVLQLFSRSLAPRCFLALGNSETLSGTEVAARFQALPGTKHLFRRLPERVGAADAQHHA